MGKIKLPESEGWQGPFEAYWTNRSWPDQEPTWSVLGVEGHFLLNDLPEGDAVALSAIFNAVSAGRLLDGVLHDDRPGKKGADDAKES